MVCSGSKMPKNTFFLYMVTPPLLRHIMVTKISNSFFQLPHRHLWLFLTIHKCLLAISYFIHDTLNLTNKQKHPIFDNFLPISLQKFDGSLHGNGSTNGTNHILTFYTQLYFKHIETCIITSWNKF